MDYYNMNFRDFINPTRKPVTKAQMEDVEEMEDFLLEKLLEYVSVKNEVPRKKK